MSQNIFFKVTIWQQEAQNTESYYQLYIVYICMPISSFIIPPFIIWMIVILNDRSRRRSQQL